MSRLYEMTIKVSGFDQARRDDIWQTIVLEWGNDYCFDAAEDHLVCTAQNSLCGGETESEFADRIARAIWKANRRYCAVEIKAVFLEDLPCEIHTRGEDHYKKWLAKQKRARR